MSSARLLYEFDQFFWHAEFIEIEETLPIGSADVEIWLNLICSDSSSLRSQGLTRLNVWLLEKVKDLNVAVLTQRSREVLSAAESEIFGRSLDLILRTSDAAQSAQTRHLLNVVFVVQQFFGISGFFPALVRNFHRMTELSGMPIRKFVKIFEKGLSESQLVPEFFLFPDKGHETKQTFPINHPQLTSFRSLVLLAKHHHALLCSHPSPPPAIRQACAVIQRWYDEFFAVYPLHAVELNFVRLEPSMHHAFLACARHKGRALSRPKLFHHEVSELFSVNTLLHNLASLLPLDRPTADQPDTPDDAASECSEVSENLLSELENFSDIHFPCDLLRDISSWFHKLGSSDATTGVVATEAAEAGKAAEAVDEKGKWTEWVKEMTGILLRVKLSACRHSAEYPHAMALEQDRLALHASLELRNVRPSELARISAEAELRKNADVIAGAVAGIFLRALELPGVGENVVAHNGLLVFLKYANGFEDGDLVGSPESSGPLGESVTFQTAFPSVKITALYRTLQLLWKLVKDHPTRVRKFILPFRSVMIMKRLMRCASYRVQRVVLKLFKVQVRFLPKKLKNMSVKFVSQVFVNSDLSTEPYDDWMLTTGLSVEDENPSFAVHQGADSVAGGTEKQEEFFEVKDEDQDEGSTWRDYTVEDLQHVNWTNPLEVKFFCDRYGVDRSKVFFGYPSFDEWLQQDVLLNTGIADLFTGQ